MSVALNEVRAAYCAACAMDIAALKPGNVSADAPGHGMTAADFLRSAEASAPIIAKPSSSLGACIRSAVEVTLERVGCNTNLGILLLCVPLAQAFMIARAETKHGKNSLQDNLRKLLDDAGTTDTEQIFAAIRMAAPGGLGASPLHDVNDIAKAPLRSVMAVAADRDLISRQYATCFQDVFTTTLPALNAARSRTSDPSRMTSDLYLSLLASFADSHVRRRHGDAVAERIRAQAALIYPAWLAEAPGSGEILLRRFDAQLKAQGINPGTTADFTVATLFLDSLLNRAFRATCEGRRQNPQRLRLLLGGAPLTSDLLIREDDCNSPNRCGDHWKAIVGRRQGGRPERFASRLLWVGDRNRLWRVAPLFAAVVSQALPTPPFFVHQRAIDRASS